MSKYAFFGGKIVRFEEAKIPVDTHSFNYGTGIFEGIRAFWNPKKGKLFVFALREHLERLIENFNLLRIKLPYSVEELVEITIKLLKKEGYEEDLYIRPIAFASSQKIKVTLEDLEHDLTIFVKPFGSYYPDEENVRAIISSWRRISDNAIPPRGKIVGSYVNSALIKGEAQSLGFDEGIALNEDGYVSEASAANIFLVEDRKIITPPVSANILEGITRELVILLIYEELRMEVQERQINRTELYKAKEIFLTGTACNISAVTQLDNRPIGKGKIGPVTKKLRDLYFSIVRGEIEETNPWQSLLTPVEYVSQPLIFKRA